MNHSDDPDRLRDEAVRWQVRLRSGGCDNPERKAFDHWLRASPRHREAYDYAETQWRWMEGFKFRSFRARDEALRYRPPRRSLRKLASVVAASSLLAALGLTAFTPDGWYGVGATYLTAKGGRETVTLADGSRLELNTNTAAKVHINHWLRSVELVRGEAYFHVAHDEDKPFEVRAGAGLVRDLGTAFEVYVQPHRVLVAVDEGSVQVEARGSRVLVAGQQLAYAHRGDFILDTGMDLAALTAWRQGQIVVRDRSLNELLEEIDRYHDTRIRLSNPAQGRLKVSGTFPTGNLESILNTIVMTLPLRVSRSGEAEIVLESSRASGRF